MPIGPAKFKHQPEAARADHDHRPGAEPPSFAAGLVSPRRLKGRQPLNALRSREVKPPGGHAERTEDGGDGVAHEGRIPTASSICRTRFIGKPTTFDISPSIK